MILRSDELHFTVKNVGDWTVYGVKCRFVIERLLFNTIAIRTIENYIASTWPDNPPLCSGESLNFKISTPKMIIPGIYMVHVHPNPDTLVPNYDSSRYEKFLSIGFVFQNWIQCY
jgi:subtilase family serine protease